MKNIWRIFKSDLKNAARNIIVFIVIIGISILPALYAWFNIAANWDPYSSTNGLSFAVCSKDKGYSYKVLTLNAGDQIVENLKQNDKMGWTFVTEKEAKEGVENGTYYAAVIIPEDFSECLFSVTTGKFRQAKLQYYLNEKKNAVAPKITDKGVQTIQESVNETYVSTVTKVIATSLNMTTDDLTAAKEDTADKILSSLDTTKNDIDSFKKSINVVISSLDTIDAIIETNKEMLPTVQKRIAASGEIPQDIKGTLQSVHQSTVLITEAVGDIIDSMEAYTDKLQTKVNEAFANVGTDSAAASKNLREVTVISEKILAVNNHIIHILETIQNTFGFDMSPLLTKINAANNHQNGIITAVNNAGDTIEKTGSLPQKTQADLRQLVDSASDDFEIISTAFSAIQSQLNTAMDKVYQSLDNATEILITLSGDVPNLTKSLENTSTTVASMKTTFENLKEYLDTAIQKIDTMKEKVSEIRNSTYIEDIVMPIIQDPKALGDFVSSPVAITTTRIHPVMNYGSGMTPFYSSLAFWVGGIILVAVLKTDLTKHELRRLEKPTTTQLFFGRYLIFFFIGQLQALIISLGDVFFLKVQINDPLLFVAGSLLSSFVYTLLIYSLTITFSTIGKALAVIILVIQIAGSGGTFPIEVLPEPFRVVSPLLPFKYGINALREAVAGPDLSGFGTDILCLFAFVPFALLLGLLLRKPCIKLMTFFNERVEQSDIVI